MQLPLLALRTEGLSTAAVPVTPAETAASSMAEEWDSILRSERVL